MDKRILTIILSLAMNVSDVTPQSKWQWITSSPPKTQQIYSTCIVGNKAYFWGNENTVYSTEDTGASFIIYPPYGPLNNVENGFYPMQGIAFADSLIGYIVDIAHGEFRTTDGGWTWTQFAQEGSNTSLVAFGSSKIGWKMGAAAGFYRTTDAGTTWTYLDTPLFGGWINFQGNFAKICPIDAKNLWVLKTDQEDSSKPGPIWRSSDSGLDWTNIHTSMPFDTLNQVTYEDLVMKPSGMGCITGTVYTPTMNYDSIRGFVLMTTNFGNTWTRNDFPNEDYFNITTLNDSVWVLLGNARSHSYNLWGQSIERRSTDMGKSWIYSPVFGSDTIQFQTFFSSAYIPQLNTLLAATVQGIYKSTDRGKSFLKITSDKDIQAQFITVDKSASLNSQQTLICPSYGLDYLISQDGGITWARKQLPGYLMVTMRDLRVAGGKMYQIVEDYAQNGSTQLECSTDFGDTWSHLSVPSYGAMRGLAVSGPDTLAMQAYPNIVVSVDGGDSWSQGPMSPNFWVNETQVVSRKNIFAAGGYYDTSATKGMIYQSTDAGFDWRIQDFSAEMQQINMISGMTGFAVSSSSKLYRTTDGGKSWNIALTGVTSFAFFDSRRGIASNLQLTTDGGASWKSSGLSSPYLESSTSMEFNLAGDLFVAQSGALLRYPNAVSLFPASSTTFQDNVDPQLIVLEQNNPNPFNPTTMISFTLPTTQSVQIKVYDILGREVETIVNDTFKAGSHSFEFEGSRLASGVYFYRLTAGNFSAIKKMLLLK
jgi:photosystem II stability/assembly factor-like uncharacterized protein